MSNQEKTLFCGIDIGSSATKMVILNDQKEILDVEVIPQGVGGRATDIIFQRILQRNPSFVHYKMLRVATGYGRLQCDDVCFQRSEITCHAKGVIHLIPEARTIIDIGGQDAKVIQLSAKGNIEAFVMNDKCSAGTGRFLDVMSQVLCLDITQMGDADAKADKVIPISSTCTVFAESEVISSLSHAEKPENIIAGIHASVAAKVASLAKRTTIKEQVVLTGGVAQNQGILRALSQELNRPILLPPMPQFTGALGAAIYAIESVKA